MSVKYHRRLCYQHRELRQMSLVQKPIESFPTLPHERHEHCREWLSPGFLPPAPPAVQRKNSSSWEQCCPVCSMDRYWLHCLLPRSGKDRKWEQACRNLFSNLTLPGQPSTLCYILPIINLQWILFFLWHFATTSLRNTALERTVHSPVQPPAIPDVKDGSHKPELGLWFPVFPSVYRKRMQWNSANR